MLTETLSGKCPCCGYDKLLQRYGSMGYFVLDGCARCGFGYATNHYDGETFGVDAWIGYGKYILECSSEEWESKIPGMTDEEVRLAVFNWCETQERCNDVEETIFVYSEEDIERHRSLGLKILN